MKCKIMYDGFCDVTSESCNGEMCEICDVYKEYVTGWRYNDDEE